MRRRDHKSDSLHSQQELIIDDTFSDLAEVLREEAQKKASIEHEPFELYVNKIRAKLHVDTDRFATRLGKGYQALIEELKQ